LQQLKEINNMAKVRTIANCVSGGAGSSAVALLRCGIGREGSCYVSVVANIFPETPPNGVTVV
jgi:hypothetical protein